MGWLRDKLVGGKSVGAPAVGVCDCCNATLARADAYFVATKDVVLSQAYWRVSFANIKQLTDGFALDQSQLLHMFEGQLRQAAGQRSPWSICENCSEFFILDRDAARAHAVGNSRPAGAGPVDPSGCVLFAAAAWEDVFGRWPANVQPHAVIDRCDLCRKRVHSGEISTTVPEARLGDFRAHGLLDRDPVVPVRPELQGWRLCHPCTARLLARAHRAGYSVV